MSNTLIPLFKRIGKGITDFWPECVLVTLWAVLGLAQLGSYASPINGSAPLQQLLSHGLLNLRQWLSGSDELKAGSDLLANFLGNRVWVKTVSTLSLGLALAGCYGLGLLLFRHRITAIVGTVILLFSPISWQLFGATDGQALAIFGSVFWWVCAYLAWTGDAVSNRNRFYHPEGTGLCFVLGLLPIGISLCMPSLGQAVAVVFLFVLAVLLLAVNVAPKTVSGRSKHAVGYSFKRSHVSHTHTLQPIELTPLQLSLLWVLLGVLAGLLLLALPCWLVNKDMPGWSPNPADWRSALDASLNSPSFWGAWLNLSQSKATALIETLLSGTWPWTFLLGLVAFSVLWQKRSRALKGKSAEAWGDLGGIRFLQILFGISVLMFVIDILDLGIWGASLSHPLLDCWGLVLPLGLCLAQVFSPLWANNQGATVGAHKQFDPESSKRVQWAVDISLVLILGISLIATYILFNNLPDHFPGEGSGVSLWRLPGIPTLETLKLGPLTLGEGCPMLPFPIWKLWLLPLPLITLFLALSVLVLWHWSLTEQKGQPQSSFSTHSNHLGGFSLIGFGLIALLWGSYGVWIGHAIFDRPADLSLTAYARGIYQPEAGLPFTYLLTYQPSLTPHTETRLESFLPNQRVTSLPDYKPLRVQTFHNREELLNILQLFSATDNVMPALVLIRSKDYYLLPGDVRLNLRLIAHQWAWRWEPWRFLSDSFSTELPHSGWIPQTDSWLLLETLPTEVLLKSDTILPPSSSIGLRGRRRHHRKKI